jgi:hypothetical protein
MSIDLYSSTAIGMLMRSVPIAGEPRIWRRKEADLFSELYAKAINMLQVACSCFVPGARVQCSSMLMCGALRGSPCVHVRLLDYIPIVPTTTQVLWSEEQKLQFILHN